ncbi:DNA polymerase IV [bacterium]|nr:DNA polymerase IV [bacterium]
MIIHVDMDAFFASVEQRDFPELRGQPVLVGGVTARSVVAAASYEARAFGCRSAMPMQQALRLCPKAVVQPHRFGVYREVSQQIRNIFALFTPLVEPLSLDEAFLDVAGSQASLGPAEKMAMQMKQMIRDQTKLIASVGIAPVKFVAKIASDAGKPNGFVMVRPAEVVDFLGPLPVSRLWGVGEATGKKLTKLGITTIADLRRFTPERLTQELGRQGRHLWELAQGIDPRPVVPEREPQSISHEETFEEDLTDSAELHSELHLLADEVAQRLRGEKFLATTITLKIRLANFRTITRQRTLSEPTDQTRLVWEATQAIWHEWHRPARQGIRLLGVGVSGLVRPKTRQPSLFDESVDDSSRQVDQAVDAIRLRFGNDSLKSADLLRHHPRS